MTVSIRHFGIIAAALIALAVACVSSPGLLAAPAGFAVARDSEGGISYLFWETPGYEVISYEVEWRFADVQLWTSLGEVSALSVTSRVSQQVHVDDRHVGRLTLGYDAEYCYRVRAHGNGDDVSQWSAESCALNSNYWWTQPAIGYPPGWLSDIEIERAEGHAALSWTFTDINWTEPQDWTDTVEVWRRPADSAAYETIASLPPETGGRMMYLDETSGDYCYRLAVAGSLFFPRLYGDICP
jgi:hypothetical protein